MLSCFILPHSSLTSLVTLLQSSLMVTRFSWSPLDTDQGLAGYSQCRGSGGRSAVTQVSAPPLPLLNCSARVTCPEHRSWSADHLQGASYTTCATIYRVLIIASYSYITCANISWISRNFHINTKRRNHFLSSNLWRQVLKYPKNNVVIFCLQSQS